VIWLPEATVAEGLNKHTQLYLMCDYNKREDNDMTQKEFLMKWQRT